MKDEIRRIMKLVQEGKLSPEDGSELVEAFSDTAVEEEATTEATAEAPKAPGEPRTEDEASKPEEPKPGAEAPKDPFGSLIDSIERITKDVAKNVNWQDIAKQVREGVHKGVDAVKQAAEEAKKSGGFTFFGHAESKTIELPLNVPGGKVLRIEGSAGDVQITGGAEQGKLVATASFRGVTHEEAKQKADAYTPVLEESEQYVLLRQPEGHDFSVDLEIEVPAGVPVELKVVSGDIKVEGTKSSCRIVGKSGDVELQDLVGAVDVSLTSGDITISDADASVLSVETKSGDVELDRVSGSISIRTSSGDVKVDGCKGRTISVEAASGDIHIDVDEPVRGPVNARTVSGDITVSIPDGSDCRVSLATLRGDVSCDIELTDENRENQRITGRLGNGDGTVDISAVNGDVTLELRDSS